MIEDPNVFEVYGASETCPPVIYNQVCRRSDPMVLGRPVNGAEVYLLDENGEKITESGRIDEAAAVNVPFHSGSLLCLFYTGEEKAEDDLKAFAGTILPEYMVPDRFIHLEEMPRNARRKVDFPALKDLAGTMQ